MSRRNLSIYFLSNIGVCVGDIKDIHPHAHHFIQVSLGLQAGFNIMIGENNFQSRAIIINKNIEHQYSGLDEHQVIILIDPESQIGQQIQTKILLSKPFEFLDLDFIKHFSPFKSESSLQIDETSFILKEFLRELVGYEKLNRGIDSRIETIQNLIKHNDISLDSKTLAKAAFLSESRLIHLFKEEVGISIKQYILWQKLMRAIQYMMDGENLTDAAIVAGFSDSAHLSRTFKRMFGVTPSEIFKNSNSVQVFLSNED